MSSDLTQDRTEALNSLGSALATAWKAQGFIDPPPEANRPRNRREAYFVQDAMAAAIGQDLAGWKVGATSARMRELDGHDDVIPGRIFKSVCWQAQSLTLPAARFQNARVETEFAFRLSESCPLREAAWTVSELEAIATLHPAVEIIGNRYQLPTLSKPENSLMTIADNGGGIGFVFGEAVAQWHAVDFQHLPITLRIDGGNAADNFIGEMRCVPIQALADLVNHLQARGIALYAGDFVSTGAATVPQAVTEGCRVSADFGILGSIAISFV